MWKSPRVSYEVCSLYAGVVQQHRLNIIYRKILPVAQRAYAYVAIAYLY